MKKLIFASAAVAAASMAVPANAATMIFTDRTAFNTAAGATTLVDFNSFTTEVNFRTTPLDVGPFSIAGSGPGQGSRNRIDIPPAQFPSFDIDGTNLVNMFVGSQSSVEITFDAPVFAFGADFSRLNDGAVRTQISGAGESFVPPVDGGIRFFGFTSDTAFSNVRFENATGTTNSDGFSLDNVSFASAAVGAVPEPTTWAMMIIGFGAIGGAMRRRRKVNVKVSYA